MKTIILILLFYLTVQAQNILLFGGKAYNKSFEPQNDSLYVTETQAIAKGSALIEKVSKDSGGTRAVAYMRVIADSVGASMDSTLGYTHTISRPADTVTYIYSQALSWTQKDDNVIWVAAANDTVIIYPYEAPAANIDYMVTADGDTMFTADGDTMKTLGFIQFDFLPQFNNGEKNETDFISNGSVFAVLSERKCTMELYS